MTNDEKLTLAREALENLAYRGEDYDAQYTALDTLKKIDAIATESAPSAGSASIDTDSDPLADVWPKLNGELSQADWVIVCDAVVAYGAQQREAGRQDEAARILHLTHERDLALAAAKKAEAEALDLKIKRRWNIEVDGDDLLICKDYHDKGQPCEMERYVPAERAEKAEAALEEWRFTNKIDELQRAHDALLVRAQAAGAALAQRAAGDDDLPPLTMAVYGTREMLEQERQRRTQLAARAVGGVDAANAMEWPDELKEAMSQFRKVSFERDLNAIHPAQLELIKQIDAYREASAPMAAAHTTYATPVVSAQAPVVAAPVGDGDERAKALEEAAQMVEAVKTNVAVWQIAAAIRALAQQKG